MLICPLYKHRPTWQYYTNAYMYTLQVEAKICQYYTNAYAPSTSIGIYSNITLPSAYEYTLYKHRHLFQHYTT